MKEKPNIILIVSDTFRPDHLSINGNKSETPELDAFVRRSITFDGARVSSFPTIPMRTDWFTGRFSCLRHGWQDLDPKALTLPQILRRSGYTTQLIADTTHLQNSLFWKPFNHQHFLRGHEGDVPLSRLNVPIKPLHADHRKTRIDRPDHPALCYIQAHTNFRQHYEEDAHCALLADVACRWIEGNHRANPFMLWLDFFDVHEPWFPPEYLVRKYDPEYNGTPMPHPNYGPADVYTPAELGNMRARYAAMCTLLSKSVGRVMRLIEDTRLSENTIVVFMSDHGMFIGEHGLTGKTLIYEGRNDIFPFHPEISRMCWSMALPKSIGKSAAPGTRFPHLIQAPDLLPTFLELTGIEAPKDAPIEGRSFAPLLRGETQAPIRKLAVTASTAHIHLAQDTVHCRRPAVTDGEWTLILREPPEPGEPLLYNTRTDPGHQNNVLSANRAVAKDLHAKMLEFMSTLPPAARDRLSAAACGLK